MTFGIQCFNGSGELTFSSDAYVLAYLGKATFVSTSGYTGTVNSSRIGHSTWSFSYAGPITVAIGLKASGQAGARVLSVVPGSGTTWIITVQDLGTGTEGPSGGADFFEQNTDSDIYVFGVPLTVPAYGFAIYDAAGNLAADLTRLPLTVKARLRYGSSVLSLTTPSIVKPAVIGWVGTQHTLSSGGHGGALPFINTQYEGVWQWDGSTTIFRTDVLVQYDRDDGGIPVTTDKPAADAVLVEANGLT